MKVYPITPAFFRCEDDSAIDLSKVVSFDLSEYQDNQEFSLYAIMVNGRSYKVKSGFKTKEEAIEYRDEILEAFRKF